MKKENYSIRLEECFQLYYQEVVGVIKRYSGDDHLAEDLAQELYTRMLTRQTIPDPKNPACIGYMRKAARNICFDYIRNEIRKENNRCMYSDNMDEYAGEYHDIEEAFVNGEVISTMIDSIRQMEGVRRSMVIERYCQDKTYADIARELDLSVYVVKKRLKDIHTTLQKKIGRDFK
ncbi:MAG: RNA polymerase sigma factor [Spirochaetota bacterium]